MKPLLLPLLLLQALLIAHRLWTDRTLCFTWACAWRAAKRRVGLP